MHRFRLSLTTFLIAGLLAGGCGNTDTGKLKPADQNKPTDQQPKKDAEQKHKSTHEPSGD